MTTFDVGRDVNTAEGERRRFDSDGYLFTTRRLLPRLRELSDADINVITMENPRRFF